MHKKRRAVDRRYEKCVQCGKRWNVSDKMKVPVDGYVCPHCKPRRREIGKAARTICGVLALMGWVLLLGITGAAETGSVGLWDWFLWASVALMITGTLMAGAGAFAAKVR